MKEIDDIPWESCPEATHYMPKNSEYFEFFAYEGEDDWAIKFAKPEHWQSREWVDSIMTNEMLSLLIERPKQQGSVSDNGWFEVEDLELPCVGTTCRILGTHNGSWGVGVIKYISSQVCVWRWEGYGDDVMNHTRSMEFKPLKSKEEQEKEEAVDEIASLIGRGTLSEDAERIWQAGYRKVK